MTPTEEPRRSPRGPRPVPRLRTVFLIVNLVILSIPVGGVLFLRLYESSLIRRTESELLTQAAFVRATYLQELLRELEARDIHDYGRPLLFADDREDEDEEFHPLPPQLSLASDEVRSRPATARVPLQPPDSVALAAGARVAPLLADVQRTTLAGMRIVDYEGTVVATTRTELGLSIRHREEVERALAGEDVRLLRRRAVDSPKPALDSISRTAGLRVFVALPLVVDGRSYGAVVLSRTPLSVAQSLYPVRWHLAGGAAALLVMVIVISGLTSFTVTRPIRELIRRTERVAEGDRGAARELESPGAREIAQLSAAFARMATALEQRADYIRSFAASVSHEFKTPLTAIRGSVELLSDHLGDMTEEERARFLSNLDQSAARLERLVGRLLELARADVARPTGEELAVGPVLERAAARAEPGRVTVDPPVDGKPRARMAGDTLAAVLGHLVENALAHGGPAANVRLSAVRQAQDERDGVSITVSDDGPGISLENAARVFDAFFTTARASGGTGLGLPIVRSLVEAHDGRVDCSSEPGRTTFRIWLPS